MQSLREYRLQQKKEMIGIYLNKVRRSSPNLWPHLFVSNVRHKNTSSHKHKPSTKMRHSDNLSNDETVERQYHVTS